MDVKGILASVPALIKKYKYAALIVVLGVVLMLIPSGKEEIPDTSVPVPSSDNTEELTVERQLASILSQIRGAGKVEVMLAIGKGTETLYQENEDTSVSDSGESIRSSVVTVTDAQRNESGLIRQINPPTYTGAIVICQGGDDPAIKLAIVDAVSKITGLGANCISVLKMK